MCTVTTLRPHLGVVQYPEDHSQITIADVPGLVEGIHMHMAIDIPAYLLFVFVSISHYMVSPLLLFSLLPIIYIHLHPGAHNNLGMGHKFLRHIERTKALLYVVDLHGFCLSDQVMNRRTYQYRFALELLHVYV